MDFVRQLFDVSDFPARWSCGQWTTIHGWVHISSDLVTGLTYLGIAGVLGLLVRRHKDITFTWTVGLFGAFAVTCALVHLCEALIFWHPIYRLSGLFKLLTAAVTLAALILLARIVPKLSALRSPQQLLHEIAERTRELQREKAVLEAVLASFPAGIAVASMETASPWITLVACPVTEALATERTGRKSVPV